MRIIAVTNANGGVGKTTTTVNVAAALGERGQRALVVDLDPQGSASRWLGVDASGRGLLDAITTKSDLAALAVPSSAPGVDIIPGSRLLAGADRMLAAEVGAEFFLRHALESLPPDRWQWVFLDCPPSMGILAVNALAAAAELLVPVEAHVMALDGLADLLGNVATVKERINPALKVAGLLVCRMDSRTRHAADVVDALRQKFGPLVFKSVIREGVRLAECPSHRLPITIYAPTSNGAADYRAAAKELQKR